ncbi:MAG: hypothetical protein ACHBN1_01380 [Heteroscytonema crispum UTEX LB 1556]
MKTSVGFLRFAPVKVARKAMFSARERLNVEGKASIASAVDEEEFYDGSE